MRGEDQTSKRLDAGFSLLETLVVLVILGLALATLSSVLRPSRHKSMTAIGAEVRVLLATARLKAISEAQATVVEIDVAGKTLRLQGDKSALQLPPALEITATVGHETIRRGVVGAILFVPDGSSTGGKIVLLDPSVNQRLTIVTSWLTGISTEAADAK